MFLYVLHCRTRVYALCIYTFWNASSQSRNRARSEYHLRRRRRVYMGKIYICNLIWKRANFWKVFFLSPVYVSHYCVRVFGQTFRRIVQTMWRLPRRHRCKKDAHNPIFGDIKFSNFPYVCARVLINDWVYFVYTDA